MNLLLGRVNQVSCIQAGGRAYWSASCSRPERADQAAECGVHVGRAAQAISG
jgi:hypothetical protein